MLGIAQENSSLKLMTGKRRGVKYYEFFCKQQSAKSEVLDVSAFNRASPGPLNGALVGKEGQHSGVGRMV